MRRHLFLLLFLSLILSPVFPAPISLTQIEACQSLGVDVIDIYTSGDVKPRGILEDDQLVIDLPNTTIDKSLAVSKRASKRIKDITVKALANKTQIIIDLKKDVDYEIINLFGKNKSVVEIYDHIDYTAELMAAWERKNLKDKGQTLKPYKYEPAPSQAFQPLQGKVIVLDPGHGGSDPGAISCQGIPEKGLTLQTARQAATFLQKLGATVYLTRSEDRRSNLADITDFANQLPADIFISIHYNFSGKADVAGTETYYYNNNSKQFAKAMHRSLLFGLEQKDRGLRRVMFYTVHHTNMPAVLVEPLYLSNDQEAKLANSAEYQERIAWAIAQGVKNYF